MPVKPIYRGIRVRLITDPERQVGMVVRGMGRRAIVKWPDKQRPMLHTKRFLEVVNGRRDQLDV